MGNKASSANKADSFFSNKLAVGLTGAAVLVVLFVVTFFLSSFLFSSGNKDDDSGDSLILPDESTEDYVNNDTEDFSVKEKENINNAEDTTQPGETTTEQQQTTTVPGDSSTPGNVEYPADTASWKMICLNKNRYVGSSVEDTISLSYVAGSGELMDSRAAAAYEDMYDAASEDGIYLTPCSGYRSYSTQKRLYNEFVDEYLYQGYSREEAEDLASRRRNPPGSSEHNIGICMDIICASSSANFQNTQAYAWLQENAHNYGFILRYPEDKVAVTGVKFEPWHWRYVGVENAAAIKNSGLCLEEYLNLA